MSKKLSPGCINAIFLACVIGFCGCISTPVAAWPLQACYSLAAGWALFLARVVPHVTVNPAPIVTAIGCLIGLTGGLHMFLRWWCAAVRGPSHRWRFGGTLAVVAVVVLAFAAGIAVVGITHQTTWLVTSKEPLLQRSSIARVISQNQLKMMGIAAHNFASKHDDCFPIATVDKQEALLHSWQTQLLPYLELDKLYGQIRLDLPWSHPDNRAAFAKEIRDFQHPLVAERTANSYALSHYAGNVHLFLRDRPLNVSKDFEVHGTSQVIMVGEVAEGFQPWGDPRNCRDPALGLNRGPRSFGKPGGRTTNILMADGSVRTFTDDADPDWLQLLSLPTPGR